ncbi:Aste57867_2321 [Aphanomyces stellatus]|uniref:Aste57867_2321 protein n=1 Tax=Aphanomyces stellatus TaxID=120398 RepID=A0A485K802_9STRA|nr:hypothetical protein As57867_002316 [Aphanomyces stellatus]VFT79523.1 Aste57867_2321 [Aphanomyces stellatus]
MPALLLGELTQWQHDFGEAAEAQGVLPAPANIRDSRDTQAEYLLRFLNTKLAIARVAKLNPLATFSNQHPFALLSEEEFKAYVTRAAFAEGQKAVAALTKANLLINATTAASSVSVDWSKGSCMPPLRNQDESVAVEPFRRLMWPKWPTASPLANCFSCPSNKWSVVPPTAATRAATAVFPGLPLTTFLKTDSASTKTGKCTCLI